MERRYRTLSLGYPGGKSKCAWKIISKIPPHHIYVEPFAGSAGVFLKKPKADVNVLNDKNPEIINFFKHIAGKKVCCKVHDSRERFDRVNHRRSKSICDYIFFEQG